jgi:hypothetical protein
MHATLVQPTVREQVLKLAAIRRLRALAFFVEAFEDLVSLPATVFFAGAKLGRQTEILGLLLRADANVNHRADHDRQIRSVRRHRQIASLRHGSSIRESCGPPGTFRPLRDDRAQLEAHVDPDLVKGAITCLIFELLTMAFAGALFRGFTANVSSQSRRANKRVFRVKRAGRSASAFWESRALQTPRPCAAIAR